MFTKKWFFDIFSYHLNQRFYLVFGSFGLLVNLLSRTRRQLKRRVPSGWKRNLLIILFVLFIFYNQTRLGIINIYWTSMLRQYLRVLVGQQALYTPNFDRTFKFDKNRYVHEGFVYLWITSAVKPVDSVYLQRHARPSSYFIINHILLTKAHEESVPILF